MDDGLRRVGLVECELAELRGVARHLAAKADLAAESGAIRRELYALESRLLEAITALDIRLSAATASLERRIIK
jgi:hypothetical protein